MTDSTASFFCSITHELMVDPVIDPDGNSYEKRAIEEWIHRCATSPITRNPLSINDLRPNKALKDAIAKHRDSVQPKVHSSPSMMELQSSEITVLRSRTDNFAHISIQNSQDESRSSCDICCVVDTSGSMAEAAEIQNDKNEKYGLSQLDLVKHSLNTIIHSLNDTDRLSLVSFSSKAHIILGLTKMDDAGKKRALQAVEDLHVSR